MERNRELRTKFRPSLGRVVCSWDALKGASNREISCPGDVMHGASRSTAARRKRLVLRPFQSPAPAVPTSNRAGEPFWHCSYRLQLCVAAQHGFVKMHASLDTFISAPCERSKLREKPPVAELHDGRRMSALMELHLSPGLKSLESLVNVSSSAAVGTGLQDCDFFSLYRKSRLNYFANYG